MSLLIKHPRCENNHPLVVRKGNWGKFFGCLKFRDEGCRSTVNEPRCVNGHVMTVKINGKTREEFFSCIEWQNCNSPSYNFEIPDQWYLKKLHEEFDAEQTTEKEPTKVNQSINEFSTIIENEKQKIEREQKRLEHERLTLAKEQRRLAHQKAQEEARARWERDKENEERKANQKITGFSETNLERDIRIEEEQLRIRAQEMELAAEKMELAAEKRIQKRYQKLKLSQEEIEEHNRLLENTYSYNQLMKVPDEKLKEYLKTSLANRSPATIKEAKSRDWSKSPLNDLTMGAVYHDVD